MDEEMQRLQEDILWKRDDPSGRQEIAQHKDGVLAVHARYVHDPTCPLCARAARLAFGEPKDSGD